MRVELYGERDEDAIPLPPYLQDAYRLAEEFCRLLAARRQSACLLKTLLLGRVGSTIYAGRQTAETLLSTLQPLADEDDDDHLEDETSKVLTSEERATLQTFIDALEANQERDPKCTMVLEILLRHG